REHFPDRYRRLQHVLLPKDYLRYLLTGELATDVSDASGTSLFDVRQRRWSEEILQRLDIPLSFLPRVYESPEITGQVSRLAAAATGLKAGTPVVAGGGDQAAGGVGNGIVRKGSVSVTIGTSGVVFAHSDEVLQDPGGRLHTFCHAVPGTWHLMGVMLSAGGAFRWFRDTCCQMEKNLAREKHLEPYDLLTRAAASVPPGCEGLFFLPYLTGERCPHADPSARGVFLGLSLSHTHAHLTRAVMEGVTFGLRDSLEIMKEIHLPVGKKLRASGGGARSDFWCQLQADIFGCNIVRLANQEGPSLGAAILAGVGCGLFRDVPGACQTLLKETDRFTPNRKNVSLYGKVYRVYREIYPQVKPLFEKLSSLY
ncbi:MAG TPA: xylulokinase, partial [bacterium]|nr:xylulokinase [bacterium]